MTEVDRKAILELQNSLNDTKRKLYQTSAQLRSKDTSKRKSELTLREVLDLPNETRTYKAVGRAFLLTPLDEMASSLEDNIKSAEADITRLKTEAEYLEKTHDRQEKELGEMIQHYKE